jgi:hypothetical protein
MIIKLLRSKIAQVLIKNFFFYYWNNISVNFKNNKRKTNKPRLMWGTHPLINNKYWSNALKSEGYVSDTIMREYYGAINAKNDFDIYFEDILKNQYKSIPYTLKQIYQDYFIFDFVLKNYDIVHVSCYGITNDISKIKEIEFLKKFGLKTVVLPYGSDIYIYSRVLNISRRHGMLINYPEMAREEAEVKKNIYAWVENADLFIPFCQIDGIPRWDSLPCSIITIDTDKIKQKIKYSDADGINGYVNVLHAPNHRGPKGTDYIIHAIDELINEGLKVNLILIEKKQNSEILHLMNEVADIAVDEIVGTFYALFSMEGMASGLPVINNLSIEDYTRVFRRFSYLNECPLVSATIESFKDVLRVLITNPKLRRELGEAGRKFTEKYHSNQAAKEIFSTFYKKIWNEEDIDLMQYFHPLNPNSFNNKKEYIKHPLVENVLPSDYFV